MRTIHIFSESTGRYLRTIEASDPVTDKDGNIVFGRLAPNMTETPLPELESGQYARWTGAGWEAVDIPQPETATAPTEEERWASLSAEEKAQEIRDKRDDLIDSVMWRVERYQTQTALGVDTTDSESQYRAVLTYLEALRNVPEQTGFPDTVEWPVLDA